MLTQELGYGSQIERLNVALQEMFSASADKKVDEVKSLAESYHKYKHEYVKHLCFNPDNENLSKCLLNFPMFIYFQLPRLSTHHWRLCTSTLTRQPMMRLRGMKRWHFLASYALS